VNLVFASWFMTRLHRHWTTGHQRKPGEQGLLACPSVHSAAQSRDAAGTQGEKGAGTAHIVTPSRARMTHVSGRTPDHAASATTHASSCAANGRGHIDVCELTCTPHKGRLRCTVQSQGWTLKRRPPALALTPSTIWCGLTVIIFEPEESSTSAEQETCQV
jgi:hypothetical protein